MANARNNKPIVGGEINMFVGFDELQFSSLTIMEATWFYWL